MMSQENYANPIRPLEVVLREGYDWSDVAWLVECKRENVVGVLASCRACGEALGLLQVTRRLEVSMESLSPEKERATGGIELPKTLPLGGGASSGLSEDEREKERRQTEWKNGMPVSTEVQKQRMHEELRFLRATDLLVEGPDELSLLLATGFDRVGEGYEKRLGPWKEHSSFRERIEGLNQLIALQSNEIQLCRTGLESPEELPYPDLVREFMESQQKGVMNTWDTLRKVEANGEEMPTQPYFFDPGEGDLRVGIMIVCPRCTRANALRATLEDVSARLDLVLTGENSQK